jgi:hypothetical protein
LEVLMTRMERALGEDAMGLLRKQLDFWQRAGLDSLIEQWRQKQIARMFSLSEFVKCVKFRFTRWYNRKTGRKGGLWESRFSSTIVKEEERALRTMAAYIDLNPVRAGMVSDPADYRWSGSAEATAGKARDRRGLVRIIGQMAWPRETAAGAALGRFRFSGFRGAPGAGVLPGDSGRTGDHPDPRGWLGNAPRGI